MTVSEDSFEYVPKAVPERDNRKHSYRDDVRRTIFCHKFRPSKTHFSRISDIYALFLTDNGYKSDSPLLQEKFRSALGRVLRPPSTADAFALSFAVPSVTKYPGFISIVSPDCESIVLADEIRNKKYENGRRRREAAQDCKEISELRQSRFERKLNAPTDVPEQPPQKLSFRYVDELISLTCAEDLLKLKVRYRNVFYLNILKLCLACLHGVSKRIGPLFLTIATSGSFFISIFNSPSILNRYFQTERYVTTISRYKIGLQQII